MSEERQSWESDGQTSSSPSVMTFALCFLPILFQEDSQTKDGPVLLSQGWGTYCRYVVALVTIHAHTPSQLKFWSSTTKLVLGLSVCKIHFWKAIICSRDSELNVLDQVADGKMLFLEFMTSNMLQHRTFVSHDDQKNSHFVHLFTLSVVSLANTALKDLTLAKRTEQRHFCVTFSRDLLSQFSLSMLLLSRLEMIPKAIAWLLRQNTSANRTKNCILFTEHMWR